MKRFLFFLLSAMLTLAALAQSQPGDIFFSAATSSTESCSRLECNGQEVAIANYPELYARIGYTYGTGSGTNFRVPDLSSRFIMAAGQGSTRADHTIGQTGGVEWTTLSTDQLPPHSHSATVRQPVNVLAGNTADPTNAVPANTTGLDREYQPSATPGVYFSPAEVTIGSTGSGAQIPILNPYMTLRAFIVTGK